MNKIKILTVSTSGLTHKEGISTVIFDNYSRFDKKKFDLQIVVSGDYNDELVHEFKNVGIIPIYVHSRKKNTILYIKEICSLLKKERYDALYIHGSSSIMSIELFIAKLCGCKVRVVHSHNTTCDHKFIDKLLRPFFYRLYTDALACGNDAGKWLFGGKNFTVLKNGRDIEKYCFDLNTRHKIRNTLNISDDVIMIGHVGNFNKQKNQKYTLLILQELLKSNNNIKLCLMGNGIMLDEIKKEAEQMGLSNNVMFTGSISNVNEMLQAMDVMILPSLYEGLPLVVVEWQISSLPCILSDNVTDECVFSDIVSFAALDDLSLWKNKILEMVKIDRKQLAKSQITLAKKAGFDINQNAIDLQQFFANKCKKGN